VQIVKCPTVLNNLPMSNEYQNMNSRNREIAICYALARYGYRCYHCNTFVADLIMESDLKEEFTGKERKLPVLILDKLNNDGIHDDPTDPDLVPSCYSCNRNKNKHDTSQASGNEISRAKVDSLIHEPLYHNNLQTKLLDMEHLCFNEMKYAGKILSEGMNEVTCVRYFNSNKFTDTNQKGIYSTFPHKCSSPDCNGVHVCLKHEIPKSLIKQEINDLKKEYNREYMDGDRNKFIHHSGTMFKEFITFREFYTQRTKLLKHFPTVNLEEIIS